MGRVGGSVCACIGIHEIRRCHSPFIRSHCGAPATLLYPTLLGWAAGFAGCFASSLLPKQRASNEANLRTKRQHLKKRSVNDERTSICCRRRRRCEGEKQRKRKEKTKRRRRERTLSVWTPRWMQRPRRLSAACKLDGGGAEILRRNGGTQTK